MLYLCFFKPLRDHLRGFLIAAWAGDKIAEFSFPEISFHFPLRPWFFFVSPAYAGKSHSYLNSTFLNLGSPPRMRGKARQQEHLAAQSGITPACAGKSFGLLVPMHRTQDHPRVCGEKTGCPGSLGSRIGSPPHVRRKGLPGPVMRITGGITPACAGKSFLRSSSQSRSGDHPRVCGEKVYKDIKHVAAVGSPPRMRGKVT